MKTTSTYILSLIVGTLIFIGGDLAHAEQKGMRTAEVKLTHAFAKRVAEDHHDTCKAMAEFGIDYPVLVQRALDGEPRAIRLMLSLARMARFDGAVAESYSATRYKVAMLVGDDKLIEAYRFFSPSIEFSFIRESFLGWPNPESEPEKAEAEVKKRLPKFWNFLTKKVEPAAATDR